MNGDSSGLMPALPGETPELPTALEQDIADWNAEDPSGRESPFEVSVSGDEVIVDDTWTGDTMVYRQFKTESQAEKAAESLEAALERIIATKLTFAEIRSRIEDWEEGIPLNASPTVRARRGAKPPRKAPKSTPATFNVAVNTSKRRIAVTNSATGEEIASVPFPVGTNVVRVVNVIATRLQPKFAAGATVPEAAQLWRDELAVELVSARKAHADDAHALEDIRAQDELYAAPASFPAWGWLMIGAGIVGAIAAAVALAR